MYVCTLSHCSCVRLFLTLLTIAHPAPLSMGFSRQNTRVGCQAQYHILMQYPFLFTGYHIPNPEIIFRIEEGKEPWMRETEVPCQRYHGE